MRYPLILLTLVSTGILVSAAPFPALAEWPSLGRAVCTDPNEQQRPRAASDGAEGAIIVWQDFRGPRVGVFAARVLASGGLDPAWPVNGTTLLIDPSALPTDFGGRDSPVIVPDGTGGAVVAWEDWRSLANGIDIFAQHVLGSGVVDPAWPANGRALCTAVSDQHLPELVSDGAGGAIVIWMDDRNAATSVDLYAQHVLASGVVDPAWPSDGRPLSTASAPQVYPKIAPDGSGGAIVTWYDYRLGSTNTDIYAQHVTSTGIIDPEWPEQGRALCLAAGDQINPTIVSDGAGGAIVTWEDPRDGTSHIYAQRVLGSGAIAPGWPVNGSAVCIAPVLQDHPIIASDGASGAIVTWQDARNNANHNPYAQHVLASGAIDAAWPVDGRALSLSSGEESEPSIVADGAGGAFVAWNEDFFVLVHHVEASGVLDPTFPIYGRFVRLLLSFQSTPDLAAAGPGAAVVVWGDADANSDSDIYATQVLGSETTGVGDTPSARVISLAPPSPNPAFGAVALRFALPRAARVSLAIYGPNGRRVRELASGSQTPGAHSIVWDLRDQSGHVVGAGIYFARLESEGLMLTQKIVRLK